MRNSLPHASRRTGSIVSWVSIRASSENTLEVEQEIATVRGQIEDLEAQQKKRALHVCYGAVQLTFKEEYAARFHVQLAL